MIPIENILLTLPGLTPALVERLVSEIDIRRADSISALWRYAGYGVINGQHEKQSDGDRPTYNPALKAVCCDISRQFLRVNSPYAAIYYSSREHYRFKRPEWTEAHKHQASLRKVAKIFLSHLWTAWRELEGLPTERPWIFKDPNHTHELLREDFGWEQRK